MREIRSFLAIILFCASATFVSIETFGDHGERADIHKRNGGNAENRVLREAVGGKDENRAEGALCFFHRRTGTDAFSVKRLLLRIL